LLAGAGFGQIIFRKKKPTVSRRTIVGSFLTNSMSILRSESQSM